MKLWKAVVVMLVAYGFGAEYSLLNVSYDPTREFYKEYNALFSEYYFKKTGDTVKISQSHGGSGTQARSVIDGSPADVVTLALALDIDAISSKSHKIPANWQSRLENNSAPYLSTIVFLVKKGNPKSIKDWNDLIRDDVKVITPNPKTSGGARWNHLAAWGYALQANNGDENKAREYMIKLYQNVPVLDTGARGATNTFIKRRVGDVLIAWENEAFLASEKIGKGQFEIVTPSVSILAEPPVSIVDFVVEQKGTKNVAEEYLTYLYTKNAQELIAKHFYRPIDAEIFEKYKERFKAINFFKVSDFGGWQDVQNKHFSDGGEFDKIFEFIKDHKNL